MLISYLPELHYVNQTNFEVNRNIIWDSGSWAFWDNLRLKIAYSISKQELYKL